MLDLVVNSSITHTLLFLTPIACALLLAWARCPGWPVVGGAVAGILLGPTIFGRTAPATFEEHFIGGIEERAERDEVLRRHQIDRLGAAETGRTGAALDALVDRHRIELAAADARWSEARWAAQRPLRSYSAVLVGAIFLGAGLLRLGRGEGAVDRITAGSIGLWSAALPGAVAATALIWGWGCRPAPAALAGAAVAIGPWVLDGHDRRAADDAERNGAGLIQTAGRLASVVAVLTVAAALARQRGAGGLVWAAPLLALPVGWMLPAATRTRLIRRVLDVAVVPSVAACVAVRVDLHEHFAIVPVLLFILISADGRWLGAFIGAILHGRRGGLRTMRLVLPSMAAGPTQLAIAAVAAQTHGVPEFVLPALLAGAIMIEVTGPARRAVAERLARTEEELADLEDED